MTIYTFPIVFGVSLRLTQHFETSLRLIYYAVQNANANDNSM